MHCDDAKIATIEIVPVIVLVTFRANAEKSGSAYEGVCLAGWSTDQNPIRSVSQRPHDLIVDDTPGEFWTAELRMPRFASGRFSLGRELCKEVFFGELAFQVAVVLVGGASVRKLTVESPKFEGAMSVWVLLDGKFD